MTLFATTVFGMSLMGSELSVQPPQTAVIVTETRCGYLNPEICPKGRVRHAVPSS